MKRFLELVWVRIRKYFKHPLEDLRQANPIVPGRLYSNFGYICKAVPYTGEERRIIASSVEELPDDLQAAAQKWESVPNHCLLCDFQKKGVPCPLYNILSDGRTVCEVYKYFIIKNSKV